MAAALALTVETAFHLDLYGIFPGILQQVNSCGNSAGHVSIKLLTNIEINVNGRS